MMPCIDNEILHDGRSCADSATWPDYAFQLPSLPVVDTKDIDNTFGYKQEAIGSNYGRGSTDSLLSFPEINWTDETINILRKTPCPEPKETNYAETQMSVMPGPAAPITKTDESRSQSRARTPSTKRAPSKTRSPSKVMKTIRSAKSTPNFKSLNAMYGDNLQKLKFAENTDVIPPVPALPLEWTNQGMRKSKADPFVSNTIVPITGSESLKQSYIPDQGFLDAFPPKENPTIYERMINDSNANYQEPLSCIDTMKLPHPLDTSLLDNDKYTVQYPPSMWSPSYQPPMTCIDPSPSSYNVTCNPQSTQYLPLSIPQYDPQLFSWDELDNSSQPYQISNQDYSLPKIFNTPHLPFSDNFSRPSLLPHGPQQSLLQDVIIPSIETDPSPPPIPLVSNILDAILPRRQTRSTTRSNAPSSLDIPTRMKPKRSKSHTHLRQSPASSSTNVSASPNEKSKSRDKSLANTIDFVNFTMQDSHFLLTGVAPSGSFKTKKKRDKEEEEKKREFGRVAIKAVLSGDLDVLRKVGVSLLD